jgi:hypothetical protein
LELPVTDPTSDSGFAAGDNLFTNALLWFGRKNRTPETDVTLEAVADVVGISSRTFMRWLTQAKEGKLVEASPEQREAVTNLFFESHNWFTLVAPFYLAAWMARDPDSRATEAAAFSAVAFRDLENGFVECELKLAEDFESFVLWLRPSVRKTLKMRYSMRTEDLGDWKLELNSHTYTDPLTNQRAQLNNGTSVRFYLWLVFHESAPKRV